MKKLGIVTFGNSINYGGVLQATALCYRLKKLDTAPVLITCDKMPSAWNSAKRYATVRKRLYGSEGFYTKLRILGGMTKTFFSNVHYFNAKKKVENFEKFIRDNLTITPYYADSDEIETQCEKFGAYIVGSDQVWNFDFANGEFDPRYLLKFVPDGLGKYAYAASAGGKKSDAYISRLVKEVKDFKGITVREKSLEQSMKAAGATDVWTVLDPTLLLTRSEWLQFEKCPAKKLPEHYILVYFLEKPSAQDPVIKAVAEALGLPVIDILPDRKKPWYPRIADETAGPAEFVYYAHHADYVITNSFHMTVFSLIFHKKFLALQRVGQESRIEDLLKENNLEQRLISQPTDWKHILEDYNSVEENLIAKREKAEKYLCQIRDDAAE